MYHKKDTILTKEDFELGTIQEVTERPSTCFGRNTDSCKASKLIIIQSRVNSTYCSNERPKSEEKEEQKPFELIKSQSCKFNQNDENSKGTNIKTLKEKEEEITPKYYRPMNDFSPNIEDFYENFQVNNEIKEKKNVYFI